MNKAVDDVLSERIRQVAVEGWTDEHDDQHTDCSLAMAAMAYIEHHIVHGAAIAVSPDGLVDYEDAKVPLAWPMTWEASWWKPKNPRRDLVRAAALLIAEIERIDRAEA